MRRRSLTVSPRGRTDGICYGRMRVIHPATQPAERPHVRCTTPPAERPHVGRPLWTPLIIPHGKAAKQKHPWFPISWNRESRALLKRACSAFQNPRQQCLLAFFIPELGCKRWSRIAREGGVGLWESGAQHVSSATEICKPLSSSGLAC